MILAQPAQATRWALSVLFIVFGLFSISLENTQWTVLTLVLYSLPLAIQFIPSKTMRIFACWWGIFLIFQTTVPPLIVNLDYHTLPRNYRRHFDVISGFNGINGIQTVTTDNMGFRTTKNIDYNDDTTYRIFAIGGSTTEQILLDDQKTWTHLIQRKLDEKFDFDIEVSNTALAGLRSKHHLATLEVISKMKPDMVVFMMGINDWNHHIRISTPGRLFRCYMGIQQKLQFRYSLLGRFIQLVRMKISDARMRAALGEIGVEEEFGAYFNGQRGSISRDQVRSFTPSAVSTEFQKNVEKISRYCRSQIFECVFLTQPNGYSTDISDEYSSSFWMTPPNEDYTLTLENMEYIADLYNDYLIDYFQKNGVMVYDLAAVIEPSHRSFHDECHFNEEGARQVAEHLAEFLTPVIKASIP